MSSKHLATFTWGAGPNSVSVAGGFNDWSATASPLTKQADGTFSGEIPMEYGSRHALKYVVDGEWKVREDEAKEWDAAGNCNNVYTSPAAPATSTEPSALLAASAPAAASTGTAAPASAPKSEAAAVLPDTRAETAATSNVGAAGATSSTTNDSLAATGDSIATKAVEIGGAAAAALGAVIGSAALAVEKATGVDLIHGDPAKAKGINVDALEKKELPTDATSPAGTKPPAGSADALAEKIAGLRTDAPAAATATETKPNDIPAQHETTDNHKEIPAPAITALTDKDPAKDRTTNATAASDAAKPISTSPAAHAAVAKKEEEKAAVLPSTTPAPAAAPAPAAPPAPAATPAPAAAPTASTGSTTAAVATTTAATAAVTAAAAADAAPATDAKSKNLGEQYVDPKDKTAPKTPAKETHPTATAESAFPGKLPETPAKTAAATTTNGGATPSSSKTATSTPNKSGVKKKRSFFGRMKAAFSPKDKEKK